MKITYLFFRMVLTHLIMGDMIKTTQLSELAMCIEDKDSRIAELTRLFFFELSLKGNFLTKQDRNK